MKQVFALLLAMVSLHGEKIALEEYIPSIGIFFFEDGSVYETAEKKAPSKETIDCCEFIKDETGLKALGEEKTLDLVYLGQSSTSFNSVQEFMDFGLVLLSDYYVKQVKKIGYEDDGTLESTISEGPSLEYFSQEYNQALTLYVHQMMSEGKSLSNDDLVKFFMAMKGFHEEMKMSNLLNLFEEDHSFMDGKNYIIDGSFPINEVRLVFDPAKGRYSGVFLDSPGHPKGEYKKFLAFAWLKAGPSM